jgi:peptidoglycan-N-acetylglucosamine deacetylase
MLALAITIVIILAIVIAYWLFMSSYSQVFGKYPWKASTKNKVMALTFDDGPNEPYTSQILDILDSSGVKATFFQVGKNVLKSPQTTKRILKSGHTIGNHSLSHEFHRYFQSFTFAQEILANQIILEKYIGKKPALYRSPWLWRQPILFKTLKKNGLLPISGEFCHPLEIFQLDANKIAAAALKKAKPGAIIIFHDGYNGKGGDRTNTVKAVKIVITELSKKGYTLVPVDKLLNVQPYQ